MTLTTEEEVIYKELYIRFLGKAETDFTENIPLYDEQGATGQFRTATRKFVKTYVDLKIIIGNGGVLPVGAALRAPFSIRVPAHAPMSFIIDSANKIQYTVSFVADFGNPLITNLATNSVPITVRQSPPTSVPTAALSSSVHHQTKNITTKWLLYYCPSCTNVTLTVRVNKTLFVVGETIDVTLSVDTTYTDYMKYISSVVISLYENVDRSVDAVRNVTDRHSSDRKIGDSHAFTGHEVTAQIVVPPSVSPSFVSLNDGVREPIQRNHVLYFEIVSAGAGSVDVGACGTFPAFVSDNFQVPIVIIAGQVAPQLSTVAVEAMSMERSMPMINSSGYQPVAVASRYT